MPPNKSGDQVLQDCHDDAADALRTKSVGGGTPPTCTPERDTDQAAGVALNHITAIAGKWRPQTVVVKGSAAVTGDLTLKLVSKESGNPEYLLGTVLTGWTYGYFEIPSPLFDNGDELHLECSNGGGATIDSEVLGEECS